LKNESACEFFADISPENESPELGPTNATHNYVDEARFEDACTNGLTNAPRELCDIRDAKSLNRLIDDACGSECPQGLKPSILDAN